MNREPSVPIRLASVGKTATGTVVDTRRVKQSKRGPASHYTKVEYAVRGKVYSMGHTWPLNEQARLVRGTQLEVVFDPSAPGNAVIGDAHAPDLSRQARGIRTFEVVGTVVLALLTALASR